MIEELMRASFTMAMSYRMEFDELLWHLDTLRTMFFERRHDASTGCLEIVPIQCIHTIQALMLWYSRSITDLLCFKECHDPASQTWGLLDALQITQPRQRASLVLVVHSFKQTRCRNPCCSLILAD